MRSVVRSLAPAVVCATITACSCGSAFERDAGTAPDGAGIDAASDASDAGRDANEAERDTSATESGLPDAADGGVCRPLNDPGCRSEADCVAWGAAVAPPGTYPVTMCGMRPSNPFGGNCTNGVTSCNPTASSVQCLCDPTTVCAGGFVCVSDTPGGPTRCAHQCEGH